MNAVLTSKEVLADLFGDSESRRMTEEEILKHKGLRLRAIQQIARTRRKARRKTNVQASRLKSSQLQFFVKYHHREKPGNTERFAYAELLWLHGKVFEDAILALFRYTEGSVDMMDAVSWILGEKPQEAFSFRTCAQVLGYDHEVLLEGLTARVRRYKSVAVVDGVIAPIEFRADQDTNAFLQDLRRRVQELATVPNPPNAETVERIRAASAA